MRRSRTYAKRSHRDAKVSHPDAKRSHIDAERSHRDAKRTLLSASVESLAVDITHDLGSRYRKPPLDRFAICDQKPAFRDAKTEKTDRKTVLTRPQFGLTSNWTREACWPRLKPQPAQIVHSADCISHATAISLDAPVLPTVREILK